MGCHLTQWGGERCLRQNLIRGLKDGKVGSMRSWRGALLGGEQPRPQGTALACGKQLSRGCLSRAGEGRERRGGGEGEEGKGRRGGGREGAQSDGALKALVRSSDLSQNRRRSAKAMYKMGRT